jgi:hypothetical protein
MRRSPTFTPALAAGDLDVTAHMKSGQASSGARTNVAPIKYGSSSGAWDIALAESTKSPSHADAILLRIPPIMEANRVREPTGSQLSVHSYATTISVRLFTTTICITLISTVATAQSSAPTSSERLSRFEDYPVAEVFRGTAGAPILVTTEQRRFRTRIREGISKGSGVWSGSWTDPFKSAGPNFAGHYFVIRWGCGSECVMMAIVDATTGEVYGPPLAARGSLNVPLDNLGDMEVDFRLDSRLMVLRNACSDFKDRKSCGKYYFDWKDNRFALVKFIYVDPLKNLR